jgi:hypothetical protein
MKHLTAGANVSMKKSPTMDAAKRKKRKVAKDKPFSRTLSKDGPVPRWTRVQPRGAYGKDAPFPFVKAGLNWEMVPFETCGRYCPRSCQARPLDGTHHLDLLPVSEHVRV